MKRQRHTPEQIIRKLRDRPTLPKAATFVTSCISSTYGRTLSMSTTESTPKVLRTEVLIPNM